MLEEKHKNKERFDLRRKKDTQEGCDLRRRRKLPEDASAVTRS